MLPAVDLHPMVCILINQIGHIALVSEHISNFCSGTNTHNYDIITTIFVQKGAAVAAVDAAVVAVVVVVVVAAVAANSRSKLID